MTVAFHSPMCKNELAALDSLPKAEPGRERDIKLVGIASRGKKGIHRVWNAGGPCFEHGPRILKFSVVFFVLRFRIRVSVCLLSSFDFLET